MTDRNSDSRRTSSAAEEANRAIGQAVGRLEQETEKFVSYLNEEVVPAVRQHSSRGLRIASHKLQEFADFLDQTTRQK